MRRTSGERPGPERKKLGGCSAESVSSAGIRALAARGWEPGLLSGQREGRCAVEGARPDSPQRGHEPGAAAEACSAVSGPGGRTDSGSAGRGSREGSPPQPFSSGGTAVWGLAVQGPAGPGPSLQPRGRGTLKMKAPYTQGEPYRHLRSCLLPA